MVSSWFRSGGGNRGGGAASGGGRIDGTSTIGGGSNAMNRQPTIHEVIQYMHPKKKSLNEKTCREDLTTHRTRFSTLLLEHGEDVLQDWAVLASSLLISTSATAASAAAGPAEDDVDSNTNNRKNKGSDDKTSGATGDSKSNKIQWAQSPSLNSGDHNSSERSKNSKLLYSRFSSNSSASSSFFSDKSSNSNNNMDGSSIDKEAYPSVHMNKIEGRLHLCTRSVVFEPLEASRPMVRCPFSCMPQGTAPREYPQDAPTFQSMCVEWHSIKHFTCKANNVVAPYEVVKIGLVRFRCTFLHSSPTPFCELSQRLVNLASATAAGKHHHHNKHSTSTSTAAESSNPNNNSSNASPLQEVDAMVKSMLQRPFCPDNFVDVREVPLTTTMDLQCHVCTPLQSKPGVLVVTAERIYFQPATGLISLPPPPSSRSAANKNNHGMAHYQADETIRAWSWSQRDVVATARRYHGLRDSALEIYWHFNDASKPTSSSSSAGGATTGSSSTLLAFERRHDREQVLRLLPATAPCVTDRDFLVKVVEEWHAGRLSNYDYLIALNSAAGRSFHDLSRYPVFPWVIRDYTSDKLNLKDEATFRDLSKPVGALNPDRLEYFMTRLHNMQDMENEAFLYGTHYSAPAYVLYYLVRSMPEHMLCLQNGKWDAPDRLFHSIQNCFNCVLTNHADVKELIPEFFSSGSSSGENFDFLINTKSLHLGATQLGERVDDVQLPPWANGSAREFCKKNRKALESDICTRNLPAWIDLIFGAKARGPAAVEAANLFHRTAYLGPRDLADMQTDEERFHAELQASEFGIVPDFLFTGPHPLRQQEDFSVDEFISTEVGRASSRDDSLSGGARDSAWELLDPPSSSSTHLPSSSAGECGTREMSHLNTQEEQYGDEPPMNEAPLLTQDQFSTGRRAGLEDQYNPASIMRQEAVGGTGLEVSLTENHMATSSQQQSLPLRGSGDSANRDLKTHASGSFYSPNDNATSIEVYPNTNTGATKAASQRQSSAPSCPPQVSSIPEQLSSSTATTEWDMRIIERRRIHNDAISGCVLLLDDEMPSRSILATTSLDGGLMAHKVSLGERQPAMEEPDRGVFSATLTRFSYSTILSRNQPGAPQAQSSKLTEYRTHSSRDPLACLVLASDGTDGHVAFAGGHDDVVLAYGINSACAVASVYSHRDAVTDLELITRTPFDGDSSLWLDNSTHIMVSGSWDATCKVWSLSVSAGETVAIHREPLAELFDADSSIVCVSAKSIPTSGIVIAAGCADGSFCVWNVHADGVRVVLHNEPARRGSGCSCSVVKWVPVGGSLHLFCAFSTGKVASYTLVDGVLQRVGAVSVGVAVLSLAYSEGVLLVGCSDGGLRLLPVRGASFEGKPTLWQAVNNKSSPGISCISLSYTRPEQSGEQRGQCFCSTGAEDGSIALFELTRVVR
jgi:factor associated with neutral sphingomyelinase activation